MLMVDVIQRTYRFIQELFDEDRSGKLMFELATKDPVPGWDCPTITKP